MNLFDILCSKYGRSAATTYTWLRDNGHPAKLSILAMREQVTNLGTNYPGGLECTPYRQRYH